MAESPLPIPGLKQAYCDVSALEAGLIWLTDSDFITNGTPGAVTTAPSLAFLLQHSADKNKKFVFDLGIRRDWENYPPFVVETIRSYMKVEVPQDIVTSLEKGGISPLDIATVGISHFHFDHIGDSSLFPNSTFVVGGGTRALVDAGYPSDPNSEFPSDGLPPERTRYLSETEQWEPLGPFSRALDFYGDGSLYIIDSPGHLPGHVNVLARTSADGGWIYLAGDSAHHWNLITGESGVAGHGHSCAHEDKTAAEEHILRVRKLWKSPRVRVLLAHDEPWYKENKGGTSFWPGIIPSY